MPRFEHRFTPACASHLGNGVDIETRQIEDAGLMEVLQTPGAALGTWAVFDALLVPGHRYFVFRSPLGQSREVKTALSGLFGRFVARAYATHHLGYTHFQAIHSPPMTLDGGGGCVRRAPNTSGDLPDWAAWSSTTGALAIIEAKGCNARTGLGTVLEKAYDQAKRARIMVGRKRATYKRYAIATRWGVETFGSRPKLWVKDPAVEGSTTPDEQAALGLGLARLHYATLMEGLGLTKLAESLKDLAEAEYDEQDDAVRGAINALQEAPRRRAEAEFGASPETPLVGAYVTRSGPLHPSVSLSEADYAALQKLQLRPAFVGVETSTLKAAIGGDLQTLTVQLPVRATMIGSDNTPQVDRSGVWVNRLHDDHVEIFDA